jgi:predicted nucleic acid-binding protein
VTERFVLDASVGVKWFRAERHSLEAREFLRAATDGSARVAVPTHFVHEVLSVIERRDHVPARVLEAWDIVAESGVDIVPLTDEVVREAVVQCDALGCSFYDALAPAVASLLGATLVSADVRAHAAYPGVELLR